MIRLRTTAKSASKAAGTLLRALQKYGTLSVYDAQDGSFCFTPHGIRKDRSHVLIGIYNKNCERESIYADFVYAGLEK